VLAIAGGGAAAWHYNLVNLNTIRPLLARFGFLKNADGNHAAESAPFPIVAPGSPVDPAFDRQTAGAETAASSDPAVQTPPPSSADDWYNEKTPSLASGPGDPAQAQLAAAMPPPQQEPTLTVAANPAAPERENPFATLPAASVPPSSPAAPAAAQTTVSAETANSAESDPFATASATEVTPAAGGTAFPPATASPAADPRLEAIDQQIQAGEILQAHRELSTLYWNDPSIREAIRDRIETTARSIYFEPQPHYMEPYVVQPGDQLRRIADHYNVTWEYLAKLNHADPRRIRPEQRLKVIKGPFAALIDLSDFELTIQAHGYYVRRYGIGVGKDNSSPTGTFTVENKVLNPQYTDPSGKVIAADDASNPLGERWIDLGHSYGIHGTIEPDSIGQARSRGCIRMQNADVEEVYDLLVQGSQVVIQR
jgi:LysM repeat protein